jgi:SAM-dependent methyltransferase
MDWRIKALGHWAISLSPRSADLGYLMQRRITRSLPMDDEMFADHVAVAERHLQVATSHLDRQVGTAYEFGAGWDLVIPFALARAGVPNQTVTDVHHLVRADLVADTAARLDMGPDPGSHGITYLAPVDAMSTGLPSGIFDLVSSTDTLEHVPPGQLLPLLTECRRLLAPDGVFSARIDYRDHYSYGDPQVGPFDFLRYSDRGWRRWNPPSHYQSRLRHSDHVEALRASGFETIDVIHPGSMVGSLGTVHDDFGRYTAEDLAIPEARIAARPAATASTSRSLARRRRTHPRPWPW